MLCVMEIGRLEACSRHFLDVGVLQDHVQDTGYMHRRMNTLISTITSPICPWCPRLPLSRPSVGHGDRIDQVSLGTHPVRFTKPVIARLSRSIDARDDGD